MFLRRHGRKLLALTFWVLLLGGYQLYAWRSDLTPVEAVRVLVGFMENGVAGAIVFLAVYTVRPLILFPASVLTVGAGFVFGPILGVVLTVVGSNASATVAFVLLGASFETNFSTGTMAFDPPVLVAAAIIFVLGIAASRYFKRRERRGAGLHRRGNRVKTRVCPEGGERGE